VWSGYDHHGSSTVWIMDLSWKMVKISGYQSSMNVDVDSSRDSNVGIRARTEALSIRPDPRGQ
jgi:hypothetical protein